MLTVHRHGSGIQMLLCSVDSGSSNDGITDGLEHAEVCSKNAVKFKET